MKKILPILLLIAVFILTGTSLWAQQQVLMGKVLDDQKQPLEGVTLYLYSADKLVLLKSAVSTNEGLYQFKEVPQGKYVIEATSVGFEKIRVSLAEGQPVQGQLQDIILQKASTALSEVQVEGKRPLIENKRGKLVLNVEDSPLAAGNNALDIIKRAPGVTVDQNDNILLMGQSGINVTIDGRQTYMTGDQLATLLKSTDGNQVKSVEVITATSGKDDAEGGTGRINIVLKRNKIEGFNGTFNVSAAQGRRFRGNSSLSLNYKKDNTNLFTSYSYDDGQYVNELDIERIIANEDVRKNFVQQSGMLARDKTHAYKFGIEQRTSSRNTMVLQFNGRNNTEWNDNESSTQVGIVNMPVDSIIRSWSDHDERFNNYSVNFNNEFKIDSNGRKLILDLDWSKFRNSKGADYDNRTYRSDGGQVGSEILRSGMPIEIDIYVAKVDYTHPLSKNHTIEVGAKYSNVTSDNNFLFEERVNDAWEIDEGRTNHFIYEEQISAGYIDYTGELGKWGLKAGLRAEYTVSDGNSITQQNRIKRDYLDLFPSTTLTYNAHENHILSVGYARRINRPNYRYLNPFNYFIDKYTAEKGNPYLNPQYADEYKLNYTFLQKYNLSIGFNDKRDAIVESMGQSGDTTWVIRENLGKNQDAYVNLNVPIQVTKFWSMYNNLTGVYMKFNGQVANSKLNESTVLFQGNTMNTFRISSAWAAEASVNYMSPFAYNIYKMESRWNLDLGVTKTFKDKRSIIKLAVSDVFNTGNHNLSTDFGEFNAKIRQTNDRRVVRLTYTYKFGNLKNNTNKKDTGSDEKSRAQ
ncbi:TonB-dependent receptor domain-containing protein [Sphingobacterium sp. SYP-B4668]|uniref:TonB-dependent receptor domain-containing protein n=1 Tax=Sphingobacterium sp. SYP-B4668 TaxID=2996035 RepID=UPI0022DDB9FB|nr:TonB-dependent receptor [Sphingobacterium sp. SYP-B4668]